MTGGNAAWRPLLLVSGGVGLLLLAFAGRYGYHRDELWAMIRAERARIRFGERDEIVRRARAEERLERAA